MTNANEKNEKFGNFNEALAEFMAEEGPAELLYYPPLNHCFSKPVSDPLRPFGENCTYSNFEVLATKGVSW